jgi:hypothetical protein
MATRAKHKDTGSSFRIIEPPEFTGALHEDSGMTIIEIVPRGGSAVPGALLI